MIKVAVIGAAGKMGQLLIKNILKSGDLRLSGAVGSKNSAYIGKDAGEVFGYTRCGILITDDIKTVIECSDVIIDFSTGVVVEHARIASLGGTAVVIGTTGLTEKDKNELKQIASSGGKIVCAPNMSVGVNLLFCLSEVATKVLGANYDVEVVEMHHSHKKDAPSGTAERLVEIISKVRDFDVNSDIRYGRNRTTGERTKNEIGVHSLRGGDVVGDHSVIFATDGERVELTHRATNRETFVHGALRAARFLVMAPAGFYDMQDVLGFRKNGDKFI